MLTLHANSASDIRVPVGPTVIPETETPIRASLSHGVADGGPTAVTTPVTWLANGEVRSQSEQLALVMYNGKYYEAFVV